MTKTTLKLPNNLVFVIDTNDNFFKVTDFSNNLGHEPYMMQKMLDFMDKNETYVEVGANYGDFAIQATAKLGKSGKVYAFEPGKNVFNCLKVSVSLNKLTNMVVENLAVLDTEQEINFIEAEEKDTHGSLGSYVSPAAKLSSKNAIKATTLDAYFKNNAINILRVDAEGSECKVLKGANNVLDSSTDIRIFIEWQRNLLDKYESSDSLNECLDSLISKGFIFLDTLALKSKIDYLLYKLEKKDILNNNHLEFLALRENTLQKFNQNYNATSTATERLAIAQDFLIFSTKINDADGVRKALADGADVNYFYENSHTALYFAAQEGYEQAAAALLKGGANTEIKASNGVYPLHISVQYNHLNITLSLLQYGANPNVTNSKGFPVLFHAVYKNYTEIVPALLQHNVSTDYVYNEDGSSLIQLATKKNHPEIFKSLSKKYVPSYEFTQEGINEIALISMVKNEEEIVFENLVWHFTMGFRKFVIVDNLSTDKTLEKIHLFAKLTHNHAKVFIIEDPIFEYIQARITTGMYNFAKSIWPEVKWIFPVDADEFLIMTKPLQRMLKKISSDTDAINILSHKYYPGADYYSFNDDAPFYNKLHYRDTKISHGKAAAKAQNDIQITQGNHYAERDPSANTKKDIQYIHGNTIGLSMYEFHTRSPEQIHRKYDNGRKTNLEAKKIGAIESYIDAHWDQYTNYIQKYGDKAGEAKFNESFVDLTFALDDPLPIGRAMEIFANITGEHC